MVREEKNYILTWKDWCLYGIMAIICFFTMQQGDILHTGGSSFALLKGHILDFYEYNAQYMQGNNYMLSTYILFALWNIPIALFGIVDVPTWDVPFGVLMWYKLLPTLVFVASSLVVFRISELLGLSKQKSQIISYIFLTTPVAFFSQFIFGQYDVFTVFFILLALYFYFKEGKNNIIYFALFFGIAGTFKYHAFLFFVPLLLLKEKKVLGIIKNVSFGVLPLVLINLPYISSEKFKTGVGGFGALDYILSASVSVFGTEIHIVPLVWLIVCVFAYLKEVQDVSNKNRWSIFVCNIILVLAFGFTYWHPQWLMLATPFMALSFCVSERKQILCIIDIAFSVVFFMFVVNAWPDHVDQTLFSLGVFGEKIVPQLSSTLKMRNLYPVTDRNLLFTGIAGLLIVRALILYPNNPQTEDICSERAELNWIKGRFWISILSFVIPMFICFNSAFVAKFKNLVEFSVEEREYCIGYDVKENEYSMITDDPQMLYKVDPEMISVVVVDFLKPVESDLLMQIYYAKPGEALTEEKSVIQNISAGKTQAYIELPGDNYEVIRIDINGDFSLGKISRTADKVIRVTSNHIVLAVIVCVCGVVMIVPNFVLKKRKQLSA